MIVSCLSTIKRVTREGLTYYRTSLPGLDSVSWLQMIVAGWNSCLVDLLLFSTQLRLVSRCAPEVLCVEIALNRAEIVVK